MPPFQSKSTGALRIALTTSLGVRDSVSIPNAFWACALSLIFLLVGCGGTAQNGTPVPKPMPRFEAPDLIAGRSVWMGTCRNCHLMGVSGAPAVTDYAAWQARLEKGKQALYRSALDGIRDGTGEIRMPPHGGNDRLTAVQVKRAVDYMLASVRHFNRS